MKLKGMMTAAVLAAGFAVSAPATAATTTIPLVKMGSSSVATWMVSPGSGTFLDTFLFNLPATGKVTVSLTSLQTAGPATNVNFNATNVKFNGTVVPIIARGVFELRTLVDKAVNGGVSTLVVQGASGALGTYTGTLTYAIPEPAMWALMILGFGITGAAMRTRRRQVTFAAA